jgi:hypothetical protein
MVGSRSSRVYVGLHKQRTEKDGRAAYLVQIVNQPHQLIALKVWHAFLILLPVEDVAEFIVEPG